ncbi:mitochondrial carrier domain-containing protein [Mortierella sp. GBAus27b]|nr:mitochondrial carrier domain-containing protein [Mortierella sp. GBAus27b]
MGSGSSSQPSRYETREERQIRIRKQFNQLDQKRSGFLDTNSLVSFFADITPDKNVQRRYADELLQLCHSRRSRDHHHHHHHHHHNTNGNGNGNGSHDSGNGSSHGNGHENGGGSPDSDSPDDSNSHDDDHQNCNGDHGDEDDDGHVRYDDFEVFVEEKEERLWNLFREIDHNNDNEIQPEELQASLAKAGINLSDADLQRFIKAMDKDGDGMIDFEEWRDFLVLLPRETTLKEIFHYVQEVVAQVGVDGDVVMPPSENDYVARYLLAGAIAGAVSRTATAPLDRLKVYLITNATPITTGPIAQEALKLRQRLLWTAITELYHQGGVKTFFRGNGLNIIKIAPESAIKFYTYETSKSFIVHHLPSLCIQPHHPNGHAAKAQHRDIATSGRFLAGGIAGLVSQFSIYPLETIKTRMMSSTGRSHQAPSSSSSAPVTKIWQKTGLRGFYRGLGPSLVGIFPYAAIDLSVFETLKFGYMRWKAGVHEGDEGSEEKALERPSVFVLLACGTISGSVGATSVYPLSLVRTRMQAQGTPHHPQTYTSTLDVFRKTYEKEGVRGFYKGMVPTLTKVVPAVSISYVVYEYSKRELGL